jgi:hypothetical protein
LPAATGFALADHPASLALVPALAESGRIIVSIIMTYMLVLML